MKRLTLRNGDGSVSQLLCLKWTEASERLADYEDTGLTPEEIKQSDKMLQAFIEHNRKSQFPRTLDWLLDICKAEAEGRLIVLPCKVGDTVYVINNRHIEHCKVARFVISSYGCGTRGEDLYQHIVFELSQLGKTVFLTRKEAEAALRKEQGE